jgi:hypothetical protein
MGSITRASWTATLAACLIFVACRSKTSISTEDARTASEALPGNALQVPSNQLTRLDIKQPGHEPVTLSAAGGRWRTLSPLPYPANEPAVESIVAVLAEIRIQRKVADRAEPKHRLTRDSGIVVQAWTEGGALQPFTIGASVGEETYVQRVGQAAVYAVRGRCRRFFDLSFQQLRDPTIIKLDVTTIERVSYRNPFGELSIVAAPGHAASFVGEAPAIRNFDTERASKNVAVLSELFAKSFVDPPVDKDATGLYSADTARVVISIRGAREPLTVYVGARTKDGRLHLRRSGSDQIYLVSGHLASSLLPQRSHFERSDKEMRELREQAQGRNAKADSEAPTGAAEHTHGTTLPTEVPPALMSELRDLAKQQRDQAESP